MGDHVLYDMDWENWSRRDKEMTEQLHILGKVGSSLISARAPRRIYFFL